MDDTGSAIARVLTLPGRGSTVVWDCPVPPGAPTLVLLHGVTLTAELNWSAVFPVLSRHFRVLAFDQRGHGRGLACAGGYRLEQCADDVAELTAVLGIDRFVAVGYSMGGLIAQLCWHRHRQLIAGLVLCASVRSIAGLPWARWVTLMKLPAVAVAAVSMPGMDGFRAVAAAVPRALAYDIDGDHGVFLTAPGRFAATLLAACQAICSPDTDIPGPTDLPLGAPPLNFSHPTDFWPLSGAPLVSPGMPAGQRARYPGVRRGL